MGYSYDRTDNIWLANTGEANSKAGQPVARRQYWNGITGHYVLY